MTTWFKCAWPTQLNTVPPCLVFAVSVWHDAISVRACCLCWFFLLKCSCRFAALAAWLGGRAAVEKLVFMHTSQSQVDYRFIRSSKRYLLQILEIQFPIAYHPNVNSWRMDHHFITRKNGQKLVIRWPGWVSFDWHGLYNHFTIP